jgi:putative phosphoserine phosphatase/1-acylglycerol-3-phosphate O-acyltransferase
VFNHQSQADVIILPALLRRDLAGVGKKEIADTPIIGQIMKYAGTVLIDRENSASAVESMQPLVDVLQKEGRSVCIESAGSRSTSTNFGRLKHCAFQLAIQEGLPIVPIVIHNAIDVAPKSEFILRPATVKVNVLPPVNTSKWKTETVDKHMHEIRDMFLIELDQMKLQRPNAENIDKDTSTAKAHIKRKAAKKVTKKTSSNKGLMN